MSSPNEPGNGSSPSPRPGAAPRSTGTGPVPTSGAGAERGDAPGPWPRGAAARPQQPAAGQRRPESSSPGGPTGIEERINRFISGSAPNTPAPETEPPASPTPPRADAPGRSDSISSELPDLSAPGPRPSRPAQPPARPTSEAPAPRSRLSVGTRTSGPVRASMQIRRVDPWSVLKASLVLSVALFFVWMIAVAFLYLVLGGMGVWAKLNSNVGDLLNNTNNSELVSSGTIFGGAALIGLVNIVLLTAMATVGAFIYNLTADMVGGVEVTLADRD